MLARGMMIDIHGKCIFQTGDAGAVNIGTLDDKDRIVISVDRADVANLASPGQTSIRLRHITMNDDLGILAE